MSDPARTVLDPRIFDRVNPARRKSLAVAATKSAPSRNGDQQPRSVPRSRLAKQPRQNLTTERKYVSILRADLHRSADLVTGLGLEESIARLTPAMEQMRAAVHEHDGIIHREMGDGVFAVFGAPVAEDFHAARACLAALDLLQRIEALDDPGVRVRIGVHSGLVVAGPRQLDYNRSYDFDGPPLIMAERLQAVAAPGQALASEACRILAAGYVRFGTGEARALKGFPEKVMVHPVEGVGESSKWRVNLARGTTAFVGRETEISRLLSLVETTKADGVGAFVVLSGEPGVGKSRLAHEIVDLLRDRGWQSVEAECSPILGHSPFSLLRDLLSGVAAGLTEGEMAAFRAKLSSAQTAALEVILQGAASQSGSVWATLTPRARGRAIVDAACALTSRRIGKRPTLLLIEDLQWADQASAPAIEAITTLTKRFPLSVLTTARADGAPAWLERRSPVQLSLAALEPAAGLAMLDQMLGASPLLAPLKARILHHTGAMPLFVEEVCRGLAETGTMTGAWGAFEPTSVDAELGVPLTVQGVIASRIDRLAPSEKRLLQVAATIGPQVSNRLLQVVAALREPAFSKALMALLAANMLVGLPGPAVAETAFPHECVRQVAYDAVLGPDKVALHGRIFAELEAQIEAGQGGPNIAAEAVHHAIQSREWSRAAHYAAMIGRQCLAQSALPDSTRYFEIAIDAIDQLPSSAAREASAIDLRIEARLAYANLGKVSRWLELAKEAEVRAKATGDGPRRVAALTVRAAALNFCGAPAEALEAGEVAVREAAQNGDPGWLGYAEYGLGQARYVAGKYREGVDVLSRAYERFAVEGASPPSGGTGHHLALLCSMMTCVIQVALGDEAGAVAAQKRVDAIATDNVALSAIAAGFSRGVLLLCKDDVRAAETTLARSLDLAHQQDVNLFIPVLGWHHGLALLRLGHGSDAREAFLRAKCEAANLGHRSPELRAELGIALCDASTSAALPDVIEKVLHCEKIARQQGYEPIELEALHIKSALLLAMNDTGWTTARTAAEQISMRLGAVGLERETLRVLARVSLPSTSAYDINYNPLQP